MTRSRVALAALIGLVATGCQDAADRGEEVYLRHCAGCHGEAGDGRGPSARGMWPPPRDLRAAVFKYAGVTGRELPTRPRLARIVRGGLAGTAMRAWDLPEADLAAVIERLERFSPPDHGFRDPGRSRVEPRIPPDPIASGALPEATALVEGERLYHEVMGCAACHPAHGARVTAPGARPDAALPVPRWSATFASVLLPPDLLRHPLRSVADRAPGPALDLDPRDLYRVVAYGLNGPMPGYARLGERAVWQVVYYVKRLAERRPVATPSAPP